MTVAELKDYLTQFPDEAKVYVNDVDGDRCEATEVHINRDYEVSIQ